MLWLQLQRALASMQSPSSCFCCCPGAYVTLNTDNLAVLGPSRALNVWFYPVWSLNFAQTCAVYDLDP